MKQAIEIVNLEIKEFIEEEIANVTITLLIDKNNKSDWYSFTNSGLFYLYNLPYFIYEETIDINSASKGIIEYLKNLRENKLPEGTAIACNILRCIRALDLFWN